MALAEVARRGLTKLHGFAVGFCTESPMTSAFPTKPPACADICPPRLANAQVVLFQLCNGSGPELVPRVLLQRRSERMFLPGYLGSIGGERDEEDIDSRCTAFRELAEESGLIQEGDAEELKLWKFAEGQKVDWYAGVLRQPRFAAKPPHWYECGDARVALPALPETAELAQCFGHIWVPLTDMSRVDTSIQPLMGGLTSRVWAAARHLGLDQ